MSSGSKQRCRCGSGGWAGQAMLFDPHRSVHIGKEQHAPVKSAWPDPRRALYRIGFCGAVMTSYRDVPCEHAAWQCIQAQQRRSTDVPSWRCGQGLGTVQGRSRVFGRGFTCLEEAAGVDVVSPAGDVPGRHHPQRSVRFRVHLLHHLIRLNTASHRTFAQEHITMTGALGIRSMLQVEVEHVPGETASNSRDYSRQQAVAQLNTEGSVTGWAFSR